MDGYEFGNNQQPSPNNKPSNRGQDNYQPRYKYGCACNGRYHRKASLCWKDSEKLDGINGEFISVLDYLITCVIFLPKVFIYKVVLLVEYLLIKVPALEFGDFLQFVGISMLITYNPGKMGGGILVTPL